MKTNLDMYLNFSQPLLLIFFLLHHVRHCNMSDMMQLNRVLQTMLIQETFSVTDPDCENEIMKSDDITTDTMLYSLPSKRQKTSNSADELPYGVQERLENIESHLKLNGMTLFILARLYFYLPGLFLRHKMYIPEQKGLLFCRLQYRLLTD